MLNVTCKSNRSKSWQLLQSPCHPAMFGISWEGTWCSQLVFSNSSTACLMFCKWLDCTWSCANILGWSEESEDNNWVVSGTKDSPLWLDSALVMTDSTPELPTVPKWGSRQLWQISSSCLINASPVNQASFNLNTDIQKTYTHTRTYMLFSLQNLDAKERRLGMTKRQYCRKFACICTEQKPEAPINLFLWAKSWKIPSKAANNLTISIPQ